MITKIPISVSAIIRISNFLTYSFKIKYARTITIMGDIFDTTEMIVSGKYFLKNFLYTIFFVANC